MGEVRFQRVWFLGSTIQLYCGKCPIQGIHTKQAACRLHQCPHRRHSPGALSGFDKLCSGLASLIPEMQEHIQKRRATLIFSHFYYKEKATTVGFISLGAFLSGRGFK